MEVSKEESDEVLGILSKHGGLELDEIHDECKSIDSQKHLALVLHQMNNLGLVYKINKKYHKQNTEDKKEIPESKSNNSKAIEIIDIQISTLENNISMLKQLRETLVN